MNIIEYTALVLCCTRVSNELGAGNPEAARLSVIVAMVIAAIEPIMVAIALFSCRYIFGYLFSNEKEVVNYVAEMIPLLCISVLMDNVQAVLSGVARGTGWQHIGAYVTLGAYLLCGNSSSCCFVFWSKFERKGSLDRNIDRVYCSSILLSLLAIRTGKNRQAKRGKECLKGQSQQTMNQLEEAQKEEKGKEKG
ncbi:hypothetical protein REPUB_Repub08aG0167600 [Reevesia pubescens]